jgi:hypothetical protein
MMYGASGLNPCRTRLVQRSALNSWELPIPNLVHQFFDQHTTTTNRWTTSQIQKSHFHGLNLYLALSARPQPQGYLPPQTSPWHHQPQYNSLHPSIEFPALHLPMTLKLLKVVSELSPEFSVPFILI